MYSGIIRDVVRFIMPLRWKLKNYLDAHGISVYALAKKVEGHLSRNATYHLTHNPKGIQFDTLEAIISALRQLTGTPVEVTDLLGYQEENENG